MQVQLIGFGVGWGGVKEDGIVRPVEGQAGSLTGGWVGVGGRVEAS